MFYPIIEQYANERVGVYYLNTNTIEDKDKLNTLEKIFKIEWVLSVYHINNREIVSKYEFLSKEYYDIVDDKERDDLKKEFIKEFYNLMEKIYY